MLLESGTDAEKDRSALAIRLAADMLEAVLELRFDAGQGYLLSRPAATLSKASVELFELMAAGVDAEAGAA